MNKTVLSPRDYRKGLLHLYLSLTQQCSDIREVGKVKGVNRHRCIGSSCTNMQVQERKPRGGEQSSNRERLIDTTIDRRPSARQCKRLSNFGPSDRPVERVAYRQKTGENDKHAIADLQSPYALILLQCRDQQIPRKHGEKTLTLKLHVLHAAAAKLQQVCGSTVLC